MWPTDDEHPASLLAPVSNAMVRANGGWANVALGNGIQESYTYGPPWLNSLTATSPITPATPSTATIMLSDYDADGVLSATILATTLRMLGADVSIVLPRREEGSHGKHRRHLLLRS
jgi:hypothetical protein